MPYVVKSNCRYFFFWPFYATGKGHIFGLATPIDHLRDGLAMSQIARFFPLFDFEDVVVGPGRPAGHPAENLILIGSAVVFVKPDAHPISGRELPLSLGEEKLGERIRRILSECCFRLTAQGEREVVNDVTGAVHQPQRDEDGGIKVDYGVIRRVFRGPSENTLIIEGVHRLGTLGAAKVVTTKVYLEAIQEAVKRLENYNDSLPLEILIRSNFTPDRRRDVYALETITAVPLAIVYNRQWVYDLVGEQRWVDQLPWDTELCVVGEGDALSLSFPTGDGPLPRLELRADLRAADARTRQLCRRVFAFASGRGRRVKQQPASEEEQTRLLEFLTSQADRFAMQLVHEAPHGAAVRVEDLPEGSTRAQRLRKQFLLHLALCRALNRPYLCDEESIARFFPQFEPGASNKSIPSQFIGSVRGKLHRGFETLLGSDRKPRNYVSLDFDKKLRAYRLRLDRLALVIRLRLGSPPPARPRRPRARAARAGAEIRAR